MMDEHDLTDPHGEAEALRRENARLRAEIAEATDQEFIWGALDNAHDAETTLDDYAAAVSRAQRAAIAAIRASDPVVNAGSCQPGERYQHIKRGTTYQVIGRGKLQTDAPLTDYAEVVAYRCEETGDVWVRPQSEFTPDRFRALPAAPVAEAQMVAEKFHDTYERLAPSFGYETRPDTKRFDPESPNGKLMIAVCEAVLSDLAQPGWKAIPFPKLRQRLHDAEADLAALRAQPDWKALAERLGEALRKQREVTPKAMRVLMSQGRDGLFIADDLHKSDDAARAALSDLAKMKGE